MNREDIIRMAREAGVYTAHTELTLMAGLERFAALIAAHEREECAKIAFNARTYIQAAKDIRARGDK
jgi:hypothetical protein